MEAITLSKLQSGQWITAFFIVKFVARKKSRNERDYLAIDLTRGSDAIKGYLWGAVGIGSKIKPGSSVKVKGYVKSLNNVNLIEIKQIWPVTESDIGDNNIVYCRPRVAKRAGERSQLSFWPESEDAPA